VTTTSISFDGIGHVLADKRLQVPVYQRAFSWTSEPISELLTDLWESHRRGDTEYFLGSVVLTGTGGERPSVADGQQRLASVTMIYGAIRDYLAKKGDKRAPHISARFLASLNLKTEEIEPRLRLGEIDDDFFRKRVLSEPNTADREVSARVDSHDRLASAFDTITKYLEKVTGPSPSSDVAVLVDWAEFLEERAKVIVVTVPDESNAFLIFETLNDRGLDLSIGDLLKNYILGLAQNRIDEVRTNWVKATSALEGAGGEKLVATFVRHFWASKHGPVREKNLYKDLKRNIRSKQAAVDFAVELSEHARMYAAILNSDHELWGLYGPEARQFVQTLLTLRLEQYRPLLLACIKLMKPGELRKILKLLVSWNVRLLVVGGLGGGTMERYYAQGAVQVREGKLKSAKDLAKFGGAFVPGDAAFEAAFANATVSQAFLARYYLQALERGISGQHSPELVPNPLETEVNLEHVLPQSPKAGEWPTFDDEAIAANTKRIGNLTLLRADENVKAGNRAFLAKRAAYAGSQLSLNEWIGQQQKWTEAEIQARQARLAKSAVVIWSLKQK
jgi:Protein of unknown function DUF262/Protein of unknown function (DUF1524)